METDLVAIISFVCGVVVFAFCFYKSAIKDAEKSQLPPKPIEPKDELTNYIILNAISNDIVDIIYHKKPKYSISISNWRKIKKDKFYYFDPNEVIVIFRELSLGTSTLSINNRTCIHWHFNAVDEYIPERILGQTLATVYVGEDAIQAFEDELEMKKIEGKLRKKERQKELEQIVKQRLKEEEEYY